MHQWYWITTDKFTVAFATDDKHVVTEAAPIISKFIGQHAGKLKRWCSRMSGFHITKLPDRRRV